MLHSIFVYSSHHPSAVCLVVVVVAVVIVIWASKTNQINEEKMRSVFFVGFVADAFFAIIASLRWMLNWRCIRFGCRRRCHWRCCCSCCCRCGSVMTFSCNKLITTFMWPFNSEHRGQYLERCRRQRCWWWNGLKWISAARKKKNWKQNPIWGIPSEEPRAT